MKVAHRKILDAAYSAIEEIKSNLEQVLGEIQETFEAKSDKWRQSDAGYAVEAEISRLEDAVGALEATLDHIAEAKGAE